MTSETGGQRNDTKGIQLTACLRILTFFSFKARNGNCHSICSTYLCYQGFHNLDLSELTCEHVKDDISACHWPFQRKLFLLKQRKKKATYFWNFLLSKNFLLNSNFKYSTWIYFKKIFRYWPHFFFHSRISVGKIYLFNKGSLSVRRKSIV